MPSPEEIVEGTLAREQFLLEREAVGSARRTKHEAIRIASLQALLLAVILFGWWFASGRLIDPLFFSDPISIARSLAQITMDGTLWWHLERTLTEMVLGYVFGVVFGILSATLISALPWGEPIARPMMLSVYATPKVALAPLIILWFGIDLLPKVILAASLVYFIVYFNTLAGIAAVNPQVIAAVRVMGAGRVALFLKVVLPSAVPYIFTAMRITLPAALIGAIIGEFLSSNRGVGYLIAAASSRYDTAQVFAGILALLIFVLLLNAVVSVIERRALRWQPVGPGQAGALWCPRY
jgi:NitT/TauT family transport system permease protein